MGAGVRDAFPPPMCVGVFIHLRMETPLRGRSGGHTGTAPTVSYGWITHGRLVLFGWIAHKWLMSFGWITHGRLVLFGWIARKWLFCLCEVAWINMMEIGRGGACVPARVAPSRAHPSFIPRAQCVYFWYGNAAARTFGRARRHRPYDFVWMDYAQTVDVVWVDYVEKYGGDGWGRCLCTHLFRPVKGTFHYFLKNRLARWMASLNWRGLM